MDDASCARGERAPAALDAAGQLRLELDAGYRGYLEVTDPDLMPTLLFLPRPALPESSPVLYRLLGPLDDLQHAPLGPAAPVGAHDACLDAVLVQHRAHLVGGQIDVGFAVVALHEAVPVPMTQHRSFNFFQQAAGVAKIFDMISFCSETQTFLPQARTSAQVAELVDALVSGTSE